MSEWEATTEGIRVQVEARYHPEESAPSNGYFFFSYRVEIFNEGTVPVRLVSRRWLITDGHGRRREVEGPGVVGQQPLLPPGGAFEYRSACPLPTSIGSMEGTYQMERDDGTRFDANIPAFTLADPESLN
jgi:ApaG protein